MGFPSSLLGSHYPSPPLLIGIHPSFRAQLKGQVTSSSPKWKGPLPFPVPRAWLPWVCLSWWGSQTVRTNLLYRGVNRGSERGRIVPRSHSKSDGRNRLSPFSPAPGPGTHLCVVSPFRKGVLWGGPQTNPHVAASGIWGLRYAINCLEPRLPHLS